jgi:hypothetical protein
VETKRKQIYGSRCAEADVWKQIHKHSLEIPIESLYVSERQTKLVAGNGSLRETCGLQVML